MHEEVHRADVTAPIQMELTGDAARRVRRLRNSSYAEVARSRGSGGGVEVRPGPNSSTTDQRHMRAFPCTLQRSLDWVTRSFQLTTEDLMAALGLHSRSGLGLAPKEVLEQHRIVAIGANIIPLGHQSRQQIPPLAPSPSLSSPQATTAALRRSGSWGRSPVEGIAARRAFHTWQVPSPIPSQDSGAIPSQDGLTASPEVGPRGGPGALPIGPSVVPDRVMQPNGHGVQWAEGAIPPSPHNVI